MLSGAHIDPELRPLGRIRSQRTAGSKLIFFDVVQYDHKVQILCNQRISGVSPEKFREFYHLLRRGDVFSKYAS